MVKLKQRYDDLGYPSWIDMEQPADPPRRLADRVIGPVSLVHGRGALTENGRLLKYPLTFFSF